MSKILSSFSRSADPRGTSKSPAHATDAHIHAFFACINCPMLCIYSVSGNDKSYMKLEDQQLTDNWFLG